MKKLILLVIISALFLVNCKKENTSVITEDEEVPPVKKYDTLKPLSYYPIYPGSYWKYAVNDTDTVLSQASLTYQKNSFIEFKGYIAPNSMFFTTGPSDTVYVPYLDGNPIYQYNRLEHIRDHSNQPADYYRKWPILSEKIGFTFDGDSNTKKYGDFAEHLTVRTKTVDANNDSILVLNGNWVYGPNLNCRTTKIFTKNIGLTFSLKVDTVLHDTLYKLQLINYHINN